MLKFCAVIFILFLILFFIFIFNPFEAKYSGNVFSLVSLGSDVALYIPEPKAIPEKGMLLVSWKELESTKSWKEFASTALYQDFLKGIQYKKIASQRNHIIKTYGIDPWNILEELAGKEIAVSLRLSQGKNIPDFAILSRVSFTAKALYSIMAFLPGSLHSKLGLSQENEIFSFPLSSTQCLYFKRHRDVFIIANARDWLQQIEDTEKNKIPGLLHKSALLQEKIKQKEGEILFYADASGLLKYAKRNALYLNRNMEEELKGIQTIVGEIQTSKGRIDFLFSLVVQSIQAKTWKEYFPGTKQEVTSLLPVNTFWQGNLSVPWTSLLQNWQEYIPMRDRKNFIAYEEILNQHYKTKNFIATFLTSHLESETIVCLSNSDFIKENLFPLDPYPTASLLIKVKNPEKFLSTLEQSIEKIIQESFGKSFKEEKIEFLMRQSYAGQPYFRIKFPDVSGGAIHPTIGTIGDYFIITSHAAFFKSLLDVRDQIEKSFQENKSYKNFPRNSDSIRFFLDTQGLLKSIQGLRQQILQWISLNLTKRPSTAFEKRVEKQFNEILQAIKLFESSLSFSLSLENELIKGKASLFLLPE